jgi:LuxR family maltose regulon positive regulatory protein
MAGDPGGADAYFREAVALGEQTKAQEILQAALYSRSMLAMDRGDWDLAQSLADQAVSAAKVQQPGVEEVMVWTTQARLALHRGDMDATRRALAETQRLRPILTYAFPSYATHVRLQLVRIYLALGDTAGAKAVMSEIDEVLRQRPHLGALVEEADQLRARLAADRTPAPVSATSLTGAELRVLPMLATHLSLSDIGAQMFLSVNTIRAHTRSIYRKLGVSSRTEAVQSARRLGLLEG